MGKSSRNHAGTSRNHEWRTFGLGFLLVAVFMENFPYSPPFFFSHIQRGWWDWAWLKTIHRTHQISLEIVFITFHWIVMKSKWIITYTSFLAIIIWIVMKKPNSGDRLLFWIVIWKKKSGKTFDPPIHMPCSKVTSFFVSKAGFIQWKFRPWVSDRFFDLQMAGVPLIYTIISSKNH